MTDGVPAPPWRVGLSACLAGEAVRYDGRERSERLPARRLAPWLQWCGHCPETAIGLGVPRRPIILETSAGGLIARDSADGRDLAPALADDARRWASRQPELDGYVFMDRSPSCAPVGTGLAAGVFAAILAAERPLLPQAAAERLWDPRHRELFLTRVAWHADRRRTHTDDRSGLRALQGRWWLQFALRDEDEAACLARLAESGDEADWSRRAATLLARTPHWSAVDGWLARRLDRWPLPWRRVASRLRAAGPRWRTLAMFLSQARAEGLLPAGSWIGPGVDGRGDGDGNGDGGGSGNGSGNGNTGKN